MLSPLGTLPYRRNPQTDEEDVQKTKPVIRIGNTLLFPGGATRKITRLSQLAYKLGLRHTVRPRTDREEAGLRAWR